MTDSQLEQAIKHKTLRDRCYHLANYIHNHGVFQLDIPSMKEVSREISNDDYITIMNILAKTMKDVGDKYAEKLNNI